MEPLAADSAGVFIPYYSKYIDARSTVVKGLTEVPFGMFGGQ
jgi:hypothetical protein